MGANTKYKVIELFAPNDSLPRYVEACRIDRESPWRMIWQHRNDVETKLSNWFRELAELGQEPVERCLLGRNVSLDEKCARAVAKFRIEEISKMSGGWPEYPDFICNEIYARGRGHKRPIWANGVKYDSVTEAAKAAGITRRAVWDRLHHGGWNWG